MSANERMNTVEKKQFIVKIYMQYKKLKHKNINRPKLTAGLMIKLSIDMRRLILIEIVGYKRLVLLVREVGRG